MLYTWLEAITYKLKICIISFLKYKVVFYKDLIDWNKLTTYYKQNQLCCLSVKKDGMQIKSSKCYEMIRLLSIGFGDAR